MATFCIWHGYLLGGTGSNIYTSYIVDSWVAAGHDVVLMCQDPHPHDHPSIHELVRVRGREEVSREELVPGSQRTGGTCTMVQPDIDGLLPVYLLDRYAGFEVKRFVDLTESELDHYMRRNAEALDGVLERYAPAGVLVNHAVMAPPMLRPVCEARGVPYLVKIHGSELEYAIAESPERFVPFARAGLEGAAAVLVGSEHIHRRMDELLGADCSAGRVRLVPPGVDLRLFEPAIEPSTRVEVHERLVTVLRDREQVSRGRDAAAAAALDDALAAPAEELVVRLQQLHQTQGYEERDPEQGAADALAAVDPVAQPIVAFVGKTIRQKGAQLLVAAMPLVHDAVPDVHFVVVGFGQLREALEAQLLAQSRGDWQLLRALVEHGMAIDGGPDEPYPHVADFLDELERDTPARERYLAAARGLERRVTFTGPVNHEVLAALWPLCRTSIVPSISAEAFGMVSAEAAACGCPPVVAYHSGLADVADAIVEGYPEWGRSLVSFALEPGAAPVHELARIVTELCTLEPKRHRELAHAARAVVERQWGWGTIAGQLADLMVAPPATA